MASKILVVGGAGYIGSHTSKLLSQQGYEVVVLDNLTGGYREFVKWGRFYQGDMGNKELLSEIFQDNKIDAVLHFGAFINVGESVSNPGKYIENNVEQTLILLDTMLLYGVKKIVFSSTAAVYGEPQAIPIKEEQALQPLNPYGESKLAVEQMLAALAKDQGLSYVALRYFNACGGDKEAETGERHTPETHLIPLVLQAVYDDSFILKVFGEDYPTADGTCIRDYIHVTDLAEAHIRALEILAEGPQAISCNIGTGKGFSVKEIISQVEKVTSLPVSYEISPRRIGDGSILVADNSLAAKLLGWTPQYSTLDNIIKTAWSWYQKEHGLD